VRTDVADLEPGLGHDADIDAAVVIAVDEHDVAIQAHEVAIEVHQRGAVLALNDTDDVGVDIVDHPPGEASGQIVVATFKDFPPRQAPAGFNPNALVEAVKKTAAQGG
jgi:hypothetical protein